MFTVNHAYKNDYIPCKYVEVLKQYLTVTIIYTSEVSHRIIHKVYRRNQTISSSVVCVVLCAVCQIWLPFPPEL